MSTLVELWQESSGEVWALREQVKYLEAAWLRAEFDADYWYFEANNPELARKRRAELTSTTCIDIRSAREMSGQCA